MKRRDFLERWGLSGLKIKLGFLEGEFRPQDPDREAAWDLYVELLTRVTTQNLPPEHGDEKAALDSVHAVFPVTREILRRRGSGAGEFAKLAIPVLNQIIRPFTAKWHRLSLAGAFGESARCAEFRTELSQIQVRLRNYTRALAAMAEVEDLTGLEDSGISARSATGSKAIALKASAGADDPLFFCALEAPGLPAEASTLRHRGIPLPGALLRRGRGAENWRGAASRLPVIRISAFQRPARPRPAVRWGPRNTPESQ